MTAQAQDLLSLKVDTSKPRVDRLTGYTACSAQNERLYLLAIIRGPYYTGTREQ